MHPGVSHLEMEDAHAGELEMMPRADSADILDAELLQAHQTKVHSSPRRIQGVGFVVDPLVPAGISALLVRGRHAVLRLRAAGLQGGLCTGLGWSLVASVFLGGQRAPKRQFCSGRGSLHMSLCLGHKAPTIAQSTLERVAAVALLTAPPTTRRL